MAKKITVAGHITLDITPAFHNPEGQKFSDILRPGKLIHVGDAVLSPGGVVTNTGLGLWKLGAEPVLIGKIGADLFGDIVEKKLDVPGCRTELIRSAEDSTSYSMVIAPRGSDRVFLHNPASNDTFTCDDIDWDVVKETDYFHFGYPPLMRQFHLEEGAELLKLFRTAKGLGLVTSLDMAAVDPASEAGRCDWDRLLRKVLPYVDLFVPSVEELGYMLDRERYDRWQKLAAGDDIVSVLSLKDDVEPLAAQALSYGCKVVLLKCGAAGMYLKTGSKDLVEEAGLDPEAWGDVEWFEKSYVPDCILSGTGAGDTSIAAFLKAVMDGCTPRESAQYAAATGACCVTAYDAISGLKTFEELRARIDGGWEKQSLIKE